MILRLPSNDAAHASSARPPKTMKHRPRVILIVESSRAYGRGCLQGIANYARIHGPWHFLQLERGLEQRPPKWLAKWKPDGVIARIENRGLARTLQALRVPIVDLRGKYQVPGVATLDTSADLTAAAAADHFLDRGFRHFAFCGYAGLNFSDSRRDAFIAYLSARGHPVHVFDPRGEPRAGATLKAESEGAFDEVQIAKWLARLPRPLALMGCNDVRGRQVLDACSEHHIRVPEEVAVVGVDNDEVLCELSNPPLSSVQPDTQRLGFLGAQMLERLLKGGRVPQTVKLVPPRTVVTRLSSDVSAIDDPVVAEAMHLIRQHACSGLNVESLLDHMTVSRATLERRFSTHLGRSPKDEIQRFRLRRAQELLVETDYPLSRIADLTGFKTVAHLSVAFKSHVGHSPGQFRTDSQESGRPGPARPQVLLRR
jgi:LacI family transcriptional regulator